MLDNQDLLSYASLLQKAFEKVSCTFYPPGQSNAKEIIMWKICFKVFNSTATKATLSDYDPPEGIVAQVWMKLNGMAIGSTDLHEGSRIKAGEEGLIEYYLQELLPAVSSGSYPGIKVSMGLLIGTSRNC